MPRFVEISGGGVVSTNFKVMSSTLAGYAHLREIDELSFACERVRKRRPHLLLVRHPKDRLVSLWQNKFVDQVDAFGTEDFAGWDRIHRLHFKFLGLSNRSSDEAIVAAFRNWDFSGFVNLLPKTLIWDRHLHPQYMLERVQRVRLKRLVPLFSAGVSERAKLEDLENHEGLRDRWGIDARKRMHRSSCGASTAYGTEADDKLIRKLYAEDFERYGYA